MSAPGAELKSVNCWCVILMGTRSPVVHRAGNVDAPPYPTICPLFQTQDRQTQTGRASAIATTFACTVTGGEVRLQLLHGVSAQNALTMERRRYATKLHCLP